VAVEGEAPTTTSLYSKATTTNSDLGYFVLTKCLEVQCELKRRNRVLLSSREL
jgi:hypothetical protein